MAMLFALVAAMFISIVPVKAEAAGAGSCTTHKATDLKWHNDADKHWQTCQKCGDVTVERSSHMDLVYSQKDATTHTVTCRTCGYTGSAAHVPVSDGSNCRCDKCNVIIDHSMEWSKSGKDTHKQECKVCDYETTATAHEWVATNNENGTHTKVCGVCGKSVTEGHQDVTTDKDCACDACGAADAQHSPVVVEKKDATCTEAGNIAHRKCEFCGKLFAETSGTELTEKDITVNARGHKAKTEWKVTEDGKHYHECSHKGCEEKLDLAAHTPGSYGHDADGHWAICTVCNNWLEETAHEWVYKSLGNNKHEVKCSVCNINASEKACKDENKDCYCDNCKGLMNHNKADMEYLCVTPTCTESGWWENWHCKTCDTHFNAAYAVVEESAVLRPATGHKAGTGIFFDETSHFRLCEVCYAKTGDDHAEVKIGETIEAHDFEVKALGNKRHQATCKVCGYQPEAENHDFSEPVHTVVDGKDAHKQICNTCKKEYEVYCEDKNGDCVCDICGTLKMHDIKPLSTQKGKDATCTAAGVKTHYKCNTCKNIFKYEGGKCTQITAQDTVIPALGHKWTPSNVMDDVDGKHVMTCGNAGCNKATVMNHYSEDGDCFCDVAGCKVIAHSHKHIYVAAVPATCTEEGTEAYYYYQGCGRKFDMHEKEITEPAKIAATGHDFGDEWVPCEGGFHAKFCANCDEFLSEEHSFANGNVQCTVCGGEEELTHVAAKAATCTENGNVEYWTSKVTGKKYADAAGNTLVADVTVKATGHNMSGWEDLGNGLGHKQVCMNNCGHTLTESHDNANGCFCTECGGFKTGHTNELVEAVPATCAKAGTQAHFKCSCGKLYDLSFNAIDKAGSIAQLKHVMDSAVKKDVKENKHYIQCKNCNYKLYENHGMELSDPNKGNYHQWLCECGELKIETHYDKNGDKKCDVCGHNMGTTNETTVEQHDNKTVYTGQSDSVNVHKDWFWNWQEWFTPSNSGGSSTTVTERVTESNTANSGAASDNGASDNGGNADEEVVAPPAGNESVEEDVMTPAAPSVPSASQTNILVQFVNWFLGLFGF